MSERGDGNRYAHAGGCILRPYLKIRCTAGRNARTTMSRRITGRVRTHKRFPSLDDMMRIGLYLNRHIKRSMVVWGMGYSMLTSLRWMYLSPMGVLEFQVKGNYFSKVFRELAGLLIGERFSGKDRPSLGRVDHKQHS
eukprot:5515053-Pyramimonas_sp.AAC.1